MLTESSIDKEWIGLLRLITQTICIHGLDTKYICFTGSQAMDHKPVEINPQLILYLFKKATL